jgi:hypothetical protein
MDTTQPTQPTNSTGNFFISQSSIDIREILPDYPSLSRMYLAVNNGNLLSELPYLVRELLQLFVWFPQERSYQYDLIAAYLMVNSNQHSVLPHLICWSDKPGSGKSVIPKFFNQLRGVPLFQGSSTYASIRNAIMSGRFETDPDTKELLDEKPYFLLFDDIRNEILLQSYFLELLKCSYSRKSEIVAIASEKGQNLEFKTFCPKVLTTIRQFWEDERLIELKRRILVMVHSQLPEEIHLEDIDYIEISQSWDVNAFNRYWEHKGLKSLRACLKNFPKEFKAYIEIGAILVDCFEYSIQEAIHVFARVQDTLNEIKDLDSLTQHLGNKESEWTTIPTAKHYAVLKDTSPEHWLNVRIANIDAFLKIRQNAITYQYCNETTICTPQQSLKELNFKCIDGYWIKFP